MKTLTLIRTLYTERATFGTLIDDSQSFVCQILELPWKANKQNVSCIPVGEYRCTYTQTTGGFKYIVHDVPGRTLIRIHIANSTKELLGCLAAGMEFTENFIHNSRTGMHMIFDAAAEKEFMLKIVGNPPVVKKVRTKKSKKSKKKK